MASPNLNLTSLTTAQVQKVVTINAAVDGLDKALCARLNRAKTDATETLTSVEALENFVFDHTGALTATRILNVPTNQKFYLMRNSTTGGFAITVQVTGGAGVTFSLTATLGWVLLHVKSGDVRSVSPGENNTYSSLGAGTSIIGTKTGIDLPFKSLLGAKSIHLSSTANDVTITGPTQQRTITAEAPTAAEDLGWFYTTLAITVTAVKAVLVGSASPSVTIVIRHDPDRSATGNQVLNAATAITSVTTGDSPAINTGDVTIPANSWVWLETTAKSGTVDYLTVTLTFTED